MADRRRKPCGCYRKIARFFPALDFTIGGAGGAVLGFPNPSTGLQSVTSHHG